MTRSIAISYVILSMRAKLNSVSTGLIQGGGLAGRTIPDPSAEGEIDVLKAVKIMLMRRIH